MRETSWVVLELSSKGEDEAINGTLKSRIVYETSFTEDDIYIPIIKQSYQEPIWLMEGYIFIKCGYGASDYYRLKQVGLVFNIISQIDENSKMISKGVISDKQLKHMIKRADNLGGSFKCGDRVRIKAGPFKGFDGEVLLTWRNEEIRMYSIRLNFRSVEILYTIDCLSVEGA